MIGFLLGLTLGGVAAGSMRMSWVWSNGYNAGCLDTTLRLTGVLGSHG